MLKFDPAVVSVDFRSNGKDFLEKAEKPVSFNVRKMRNSPEMIRRVVHSLKIIRIDSEASPDPSLRIDEWYGVVQKNIWFFKIVAGK